MNINYLRYFSVLAQVEHYTLAAARLGISQPALSSAIHQLETDLGGIKLFEKAGRNVRLTEEGRFFQSKVTTALQELEAASLALRDASVVIRLGIISGTLCGTVAREITSYAGQNSRIRFHLTEGSAEELLDMVRQEKLDMAIVDTTNRDRSLHFRKLYEQNFLVALPSDHPLAQNDYLLPQQIQQEPQVAFNYDQISRFCMPADTKSDEVLTIYTVNTAQAALDLVAAGAGIAVLSASCMQQRDDIRWVPLRNWHQALYMCILYDKWLEPPVWDFVERLVKELRNLYGHA